MEKFKKKAQDYFIIGKISQDLKKLDVACANYFKALSALNDYLLSTKNLFAKDHTSRFNLLKENFPEVYEITSSLFLIYRKTYTQEIDEEETIYLLNKIMEVFKNAGIEIPSIEKDTKKKSK